MPEENIEKMSPKPGIMTNIRVHELSLTRKAANQREFLLFKNEDNTMNEELLKILEATEADNESDLVETLKSEGYSDETVEAVTAIARLRSAFADEVDGEVIGKALGIEIEAPEPVEKGGEEDDATDDTISKSDLESLDPKLRSRVESLVDKSQDAEEQISELRKRLDEADRERRLEEWTAKADALSNISVDADELGERLLKIAESLGEEEAEATLESLRSADELAKSGAFEEHGSSLAGERGGNVYAKVQKLADEEVSKSEGEMSRAKAIDRVMKRNPDLAKQYYDEMHS